MIALRRILLLHWIVVALTLQICGAAWPVLEPFTQPAGLFLLGFGIGTWVLAAAIASELNEVSRRMALLEQINTRLASRARRRSRS